MPDTRFDLVSAGSARAEATTVVDRAWEGALQAEPRRAKIICTIASARNSEEVMVACGDLGVELSPERVPVIQKLVIRRAAEFPKPVITATQIVESMIENPRSTRAEASDVANRFFDGSDAVMVSEETATGEYRRERVTIMSRIIVEAERNVEPADTRRRPSHRRSSIAETISESIAHATEDLDMAAIAVFTESGDTAGEISKYPANSETSAFTESQPVSNRMNLLWGIRPVWHPQARSAGQLVDIAEGELLSRAKIQVGDVVGVVAEPAWLPGRPI